MATTPADAPKKEFDLSDLMKQSEYDVLPPRPDPVAETPAAAAAAAAPPPVVPSTPQTFDHPLIMIYKALALGAPLDEIRLTPLADLDIWIRQNQAVADNNARAAAAAPPAAPADPYGIEALVAENPDQADSPILKILRKVATTSEARLAALETENTGLKTQIQRQAQAKSVDVIDEGFASLDPKLFGAGGRASIDPKSPEAARRMDVIRGAGLKQGDSDAPKTNSARACSCSSRSR